MYTNTTTVEDALAQLRFKNHTVVITQSAKGALVSNSTQHFHVAGRHVEAVDTNGAGDAFAGAFLYALNHHQDLNAAAQLAVLISSEVVSQFGPRLAINDYAKLLENFQKECA